MKTVRIRQVQNAVGGRVTCYLVMAIVIGFDFLGAYSIWPDRTNTTSGERLIETGWLAALSVGSYLAFVRPVVTIREGWILVNNPLRQSHISMESIENVDASGRYLKIYVENHWVTLWATEKSNIDYLASQSEAHPQHGSLTFASASADGGPEERCADLSVVGRGPEPHLYPLNAEGSTILLTWVAYTAIAVLRHLS